MKSLPPNLSLKGAVIVLAEARTGSSLLMQTLNLLGQEVIGNFERPDLSPEGNPRGYFEHPGILAHGLTAPTLRVDPTQLEGHSVKLGLNRLVDRALSDGLVEWRALARPGVRLLLPIRHPGESLASLKVFSTPSASGREDLAMLAFLRSRLRNFGFLARQVASPEFAGEVPLCIDYAMATGDPDRYVERVAVAAGLNPTAAQRRSALANITADLHRYRKERLSLENLSRTDTAGLGRIYEILRKHNDWQAVRRALPGWSTEPSFPSKRSS